MNYNPAYLTDRERAMRKTEILKKVAKEYEHGGDPKVLLEKYRAEYLEQTGDPISMYAIRNAIASYTEGTTLKEKKKNLREEVKRLTEEGKTAEEIGELTGYSTAHIRRLKREARPQAEKPAKEETPVLTQSDIDRFSTALNQGDSLRVIMPVPLDDTQGLGIKTRMVRTTLEIKDKYKHHCVTDRGDFRWIDLYLWAKEREKCVSC